MLIAHITFIGWLHTIACLIALPAGAYVLAARKGTKRHRVWGWWYIGAMLTLNLSAFFIYKFDIIPGNPPRLGPGIFGIFHWFAVVTLLAIAIATFSALRQRGSAFWSHVHAQSILFSYFMLMGGLINEMFARVVALRELAMSLSPQAGNITQTLLLQSVQNSSTLIWLAAAFYFFRQVAKKHDRPRPETFTIGHPLRYSGGVFTGSIGLAGIVLAFMGQPGLGFMLGLIPGIFLAFRVRRLVEPVWGMPSPRQRKLGRLVIGAQVALFMLLGSSGYFQRVPPLMAWETTAILLGVSFLLMRWSHGPLMTWLGVSVLAWQGAGVAIGLPIPLLAIGDGLLKMGFGLTMVEPLLTATHPRQSPTRQSPTLALISDGVAPASRSEASVTA
ncbi:MAG TPA: DUF6609 family protein [Rhizomicrobium sp.]|nr:DUF6609 family protein [Rhizomicrobium sp.]